MTFDANFNFTVFTDQATQDLVRNKAEGRGLLYPDSFSEERLIFLPPAASALLVILNRNHNVRLAFVSRIGLTLKTTVCCGYAPKDQ